MCNYASSELCGCAAFKKTNSKVESFNYTSEFHNALEGQVSQRGSKVLEQDPTRPYSKSPKGQAVLITPQSHPNMTKGKLFQKMEREEAFSLEQSEDEP